MVCQILNCWHYKVAISCMQLLQNLPFLCITSLWSSLPLCNLHDKVQICQLGRFTRAAFKKSSYLSRTSHSFFSRPGRACPLDFIYGPSVLATVSCFLLNLWYHYLCINARFYYLYKC